MWASAREEPGMCCGGWEARPAAPSGHLTGRQTRAVLKTRQRSQAATREISAQHEENSPQEWWPSAGTGCPGGWEATTSQASGLRGSKP